jgi:two-component system, OmpR family, sensor kinase
MKLLPASLRSRIQLWHGLLLALVLGAFGSTAYRMHWESELRRMDQVLDEPISVLHRSMHAQNMRSRMQDTLRLRDLPPPEDFSLTPEAEELFLSRAWNYAVWARHGRLLAKSGTLAEVTKPEPGGLIPFVTQHRSSGKRREAFIFTPGGECLLATTSMEKELDAAEQLRWWLCGLGAAVLAAGLLVDALILRKAMRPVEQIIRVAEHVSAGHLSSRVPALGGGREMEQLTHGLNTTFASLEQAFAQQARFSADVAHELRTPVSVLIAETQSILEKERSADDYRDTVAICLRSAQRMRGLIESMLELARIQSDAVPHTDCDLASIAEEVVQSSRSIAAGLQVELRSQLASAPCQGNAAQLHQIITNLVMNALQHNHVGGHASVSTLMVEGSAVLRVENTGPGIAAAELPQVFGRFFRADASRSRKSGGVGLGLAIAKALADAHQAELRVESSEGGLTVFELRMSGW